MQRLDPPRGWGDRAAQLAGRRRDAVLAAGVAVAVAAAAIGWRAASSPTIAPPAPLPSVPASIESPPDAAPAPGASAVVHVAGAVRKPGLYELPGGARVADAIDAAGGPAARADLDALNLAEPVADGIQILVARRGESASVPSGAVPSPGATAAVLVNLNMSDQAALETIPGIGPVRAGAIIAYREENGGFASVDQLLEVSGIGPVTLESIRPYVEV